VSDLICEQCGQEVEVISIERVVYSYPVDADRTIIWHQSSEGEFLDSESQEVRCGCAICPYKIGLEGSVVLSE